MTKDIEMKKFNSLKFYAMRGILFVFIILSLLIVMSSEHTVKTGNIRSPVSHSQIFTTMIVLLFSSGIVIITVGIILIFTEKGKKRFLGLIAVGIIIILISVFSVFGGIGGGLNIVNIGVFLFLVVILCGALYFSGYIVAKYRPNIAKIFFNASAFISFFGVIVIEILIFTLYGGAFINRYPIQKCEGDISFFETQRFFFCAIFGHELPEQTPLWTIVSFIIFGFLVPFSVMFALTYGLFFGAGIDKLFGKYGKSVVGIIAFATAMYGATQLIGVFLIDLLAYGVWGIFGILIAFIIASFIRHVGMMFLKDIEQIKESIYGSFVLQDLTALQHIEQRLLNIEQAISNEKTPEDLIKIFKKMVDGIINTLTGYKASEDGRISMYAEELLGRAIELKERIENRLSKSQQKPLG